jgi:hypothetical protein
MKVFRYVALLALMVLVSCEGDQGPVGPKGDTGNANVKSGSISPTNAEWLWNSVYTLDTDTGSSTSWFTRYVDVSVPQITAGIIANGAVLVFMEPDVGSGRWVPLNYSFTSFGGTYMLNFVYEATEGLLRLHFYMTPNTGANPSTQTWQLPTFAFRYVVIAGTALQSIQSGEVDVDLRDYDSVRAFVESREGAEPAIDRP